MEGAKEKARFPLVHPFGKGFSEVVRFPRLFLLQTRGHLLQRQMPLMVGREILRLEVGETKLSRPPVVRNGNGLDHTNNMRGG